VLIDDAAGIHLMAVLEATPDHPDAPVLAIHTVDGQAVTHRDMVAIERVVAAVEDFGRHLGLLATLARGADGAAASMLPQLLAEQEAAWWGQVHRRLTRPTAPQQTTQGREYRMQDAATVTAAARPRLSLVPPPGEQEIGTDVTIARPVHVDPPQLTAEAERMARILGPRYAKLLHQFWQATWQTAPAALGDPRAWHPDTPVSVELPARLVGAILAAGCDIDAAIDE
jgi:hypothetical protein